MASLYIAFNYIRRHLPKFLLICFCCSILISSAVMIPINSSISNFGGFLQANSSKSNYSRLFFNTGEDVDYSSLAERYCGLIGITGYTNLQNHEYCIGYADEIARDSLSVKLINGKLPENKNEIAVTDSMLEILNVNIGDTVTLDMTSESPGQREFVITGTVNDYYSLFTNGEHQLVAGDNSGFARAFPRILCGKQNDYLQKNIVSNAVCNYYAELDENYNIPFFSSDGFSVNDEQSVRFYNSYYSSNADTVFSYISAVAIIVGIFFGVYICVSLLINSEKGNNEILRNIGATGVLVKRVLLWQGLFISVIASVVSVGLVFAVTELINMITVKNSLFRFNLSGNLFAILSLSAFVSVMIFFAYHILFKSSESEERKLDGILTALANEKKLQISNFAIQKYNTDDAVSKTRMPFMISSVIYLVLSAMFAFICLNTDIKSKIRQISVARAIGANNGILFRTLSVDALKKTISGYIIGFSLSAILVIVFVVFSPQSTIPYLPYIDLLIYPFAVITIISVVNLLAVFTAIRAIRKTDIYTAMARNVF